MQPHCTPPGERTLFSLLCAAMQPLGTTLYVYGGGWNLDDTGAGREAVTPFPSPAWKTFFLSQDEGYDYRRFRGSGCNPWHGAGLDCSGYLGWVIYAALHRKSGLESYVYPSTEMQVRSPHGRLDVSSVRPAASSPATCSAWRGTSGCASACAATKALSSRIPVRRRAAEQAVRAAACS